MVSADNLTQEIAAEAIRSLQYGCAKIEHCLNQIVDPQVWWRPTPDMNAIGNLMLHLSGNVGQWIVAGVGNGKDIRQRQAEFDERVMISKDELFQQLKTVVEQATTVLNAVSATELLSTKRIQGHDVTKIHAIVQSVAHFQGHVQEIICLTRQQLDQRYEYQWSPKTKEEGA